MLGSQNGTMPRLAGSDSGVVTQKPRKCSPPAGAAATARPRPAAGASRNPTRVNVRRRPCRPPADTRPQGLRDARRVNGYR